MANAKVWIGIVALLAGGALWLRRQSSSLDGMRAAPEADFACLKKLSIKNEDCHHGCGASVSCADECLLQLAEASETCGLETASDEYTFREVYATKGAPAESELAETFSRLLRNERPVEGAAPMFFRVRVEARGFPAMISAAGQKANSTALLIGRESLRDKQFPTAESEYVITWMLTEVER